MPIRYICSRCKRVIYENIIVDGSPISVLYKPKPKIYAFFGPLTPSEVRGMLGNKCPFCGKTLDSVGSSPRISNDKTVGKEIAEMARKVMRKLEPYHSYLMEKIVKILEKDSMVEFTELVERIYGSSLTHSKKHHVKKIIEKLCEQGLVEISIRDNRMYVKARNQNSKVL